MDTMTQAEQFVTDKVNALAYVGRVFNPSGVEASPEIFDRAMEQFWIAARASTDAQMAYSVRRARKMLSPADCRWLRDLSEQLRFVEEELRAAMGEAKWRRVADMGERSLLSESTR